jgi:hypothetical protein
MAPGANWMTVTLVADSGSLLFEIRPKAESFDGLRLCLLLPWIFRPPRLLQGLLRVAFCGR